jgi:hypothetical protein
VANWLHLCFFLTSAHDEGIPLLEFTAGRRCSVILHRPGQWYTPAMPKQKKSASAKLTAAQIEIVGQFNDYSYENSKLSFKQVARKELGPNPFPCTPNGKKFEVECRKVFDRKVIKMTLKLLACLVLLSAIPLFAQNAPQLSFLTPSSARR